MAETETPDPASAAEDRVARSRIRRANAADADDLAPKLPRGRGFRISKGHLFKITLTAGLLVMLIFIQRPCANAVSNFVTGFDGQGSGDKAKMPKPGTVDGSGAPKYETLKDNLTEDEWKAMVKRQGGQPAGSGSAGSREQSGSAGSGSGL